MNATGRSDRSWARQRAAELWPDEYDAFLAAKAPQRVTGLSSLSPGTRMHNRAADYNPAPT
jgi:hypothetical protein